ncbi:unnamed protein product [Pedinophyceae sp. YPF-701]|nr:unnamed protein product [Pedinophyceae sp. YPF-701]
MKRKKPRRASGAHQGPGDGDATPAAGHADRLRPDTGAAVKQSTQHNTKGAVRSQTPPSGAPAQHGGSINKQQFTFQVIAYDDVPDGGAPPHPTQPAAPARDTPSADETTPPPSPAHDTPPPGTPARSPPPEQRPDDAREPPKRKPPVLPWMKIPVAVDPSNQPDAAELEGLHPGLAAGLNDLGIRSMFPIQAAVWNIARGGVAQPHDLCVCAPTGSGKTLAFVLPMLNDLAARPTTPAPRTFGRGRAVRGLVVLPTRGLATQVFEVVASLAPRVGLSVGLVAGRVSYELEARSLMVRAAEGASYVAADVLVATPGRLVTHLRETAGFHVRRLDWLIVDEADKILRQSYSNWLRRVLAEARCGPPWAGVAHEGDAVEAGVIGAWLDEGEVRGDPRWGAVERWLAVPSGFKHGERRVVKIVASATLTRDPAKIDKLALNCPKYIALTAQDQRYSLPSTLKEWKHVVDGRYKPHALLALLSQLYPRRTVVFCSAVEGARRLHLLISHVVRNAHDAVRIGQPVEYSSRVAPRVRARALEQFRAGEFSVLVASDAATRGLDVAELECVINYDMPVYAKTYVHRAGRTARAGRTGECFTLMRPEQVRWFKDMLRKADNNYVRDWKIPREATDALKPAVDAALAAMHATLRGGGAGDGDDDDPVLGARGGGDDDSVAQTVTAQLLKAVQRARDALHSDGDDAAT